LRLLAPPRCGHSFVGPYSDSADLDPACGPVRWGNGPGSRGRTPSGPVIAFIGGRDARRLASVCVDRRVDPGIVAAPDIGPAGPTDPATRPATTGLTQAIYQRFGGIDGSAYFIGGFGMTALTANNIVLVPIRSGVGLRLGANVGYLKFTPQSTWNPF
jgi:hypothetical protein